MGQCLSTVGGVGDTPERFRGRWAQQGGLGDGFAAFGDAGKYGVLGEPAKPAYTTTADVGMGAPRGEAGKPAGYGFLHDHKPPPPALQLERIDEDAALAVVPESSPMKPLPGLGSGGSGPPLPGSECCGPPRRAPTSWTRGELVGQGAFGSVFVAMDNDTGELIAAKQVSVPHGGGAHARKVEENIRSVEEEVALLQQFDHPNIVRYLGTEKGSDALTIFLEYVPGGSIASLLAKFGSFKESVIKVYTKQILLGLEYLHSKGVMHRDIKGANILVDNTGLVKVADFGASKKLEDLVTMADGNKSVRGTPYWMAPEVITQTGHGRQADLWSVACTVLEMATGRPPWSAQYPSQVAAMFHIASAKSPPEIPQHLSPECKDFLYLCFNRDWKARPLAATLLRHPFLADVPVRSQAAAGPSPTAAAYRVAPRGSGGIDGSDAGFGTPSPMHPKVAAAQQAGLAGGAACISLQAGEGGILGDSTAALSPLGSHAIARKQQWDSAAASQQQQQQQQQPFGGRPAAGGGLGGSPVKRPALSLRASAPAFSGYASLALSQQGPEQLTPLPARIAALAPPATAPPAQQLQEQQQQVVDNSHLRSSRESGSTERGGACTDDEQLHQSSSRRRLHCNGSSQALAADDVPTSAAVTVEEQQQQQQPVAVLEAPAAAAKDTPAPQRQRPGVPDAPDSAGNSSGTNKSDYNPMEEPSWMHPAESPLAAEGTPTSAITATTAAASSPALRDAPAAPATAGGAQEVCSYVLAPPAAAEAQPTAAAAAAAELAPGGAAASAPAQPFGSHPSADGHLVWTNDDGDIDALPWDMGGWSTGSSSERAEAAAAAAGGAENAGAEGQKEQQAVDEDALIGALRRKAHHDVRASLALFEKSLNIPAVHGSLRSPKMAAGGGGSIPAARAVPPPVLALPPAPAEPQSELAPSAESIEGRGAPSASSSGPLSARLDHRAAPPLQVLQLAAAVPQATDDNWRRSAAVAHLLSGVRETATGALPPPAPLASAVSGLAALGAPFGSGSVGGGGDRESIWAAELCQELHRVKASTATVLNRRVSMHGSPMKRP